MSISVIILDNYIAQVLDIFNTHYLVKHETTNIESLQPQITVLETHFTYEALKK